MPLPLLIGVGIAASVAGTAISMKGAHDSSKAQQQQTQLEMQADAQRRQAMELDAHRRMLEATRNQQRARSMALTNASGQGAILGSGLQGGYGQISGESNTNLVGLQQNLGIGENLFGINSQISGTKIEQSQAGAMMAMGSGISSLGGALINGATAFNRLSTPSASYPGSGGFTGGTAYGSSLSGYSPNYYGDPYSGR